MGEWEQVLEGVHGSVYAGVRAMDTDSDFAKGEQRIQKWGDTVPNGTFF